MALRIIDRCEPIFTLKEDTRFMYDDALSSIPDFLIRGFPTTLFSRYNEKTFTLCQAISLKTFCLATQIFLSGFSC